MLLSLQGARLPPEVTTSVMLRDARGVMAGKPVPNLCPVRTVDLSGNRTVRAAELYTVFEMKILKG